MPTAREMIRPIVTNEIRACVLISAFASREVGTVSAALNVAAWSRGLWTDQQHTLQRGQEPPRTHGQPSGETDLKQDCCEHAQVCRPIGGAASLLNRRSVWGACASLADRETRGLR